MLSGISVSVSQNVILLSDSTGLVTSKSQAGGNIFCSADTTDNLWDPVEIGQIW